VRHAQQILTRFIQGHKLGILKLASGKEFAHNFFHSGVEQLYYALPLNWAQYLLHIEDRQMLAPG